MAGEQGFEPQLTDPESVVLPLDDSPISSSKLKVIKLNFELVMVPKVGFEPTRPCDHYALNVARLPVPPLRPITVSSFKFGNIEL